MCWIQREVYIIIHVRAQTIQNVIMLGLLCTEDLRAFRFNCLIN